MAARLTDFVHEERLFLQGPTFLLVGGKMLPTDRLVFAPIDSNPITCLLRLLNTLNTFLDVSPLDGALDCQLCQLVEHLLHLPLEHHPVACVLDLCIDTVIVVAKVAQQGKKSFQGVDCV